MENDSLTFPAIEFYNIATELDGDNGMYGRGLSDWSGNKLQGL